MCYRPTDRSRASGVNKNTPARKAAVPTRSDGRGPDDDARGRRRNCFTGEGSIINEARAAAPSRADEIAQLLDDGKLTPDAKDEDGCSLLQWAAINGRETTSYDCSWRRRRL